MFSESDCTDEVKKFEAPTLITHGEDDQIVPTSAAAMMSSKLVKGAILKVYPGVPHGVPVTLQDKINADLLEFLQS